MQVAEEDLVVQLLSSSFRALQRWSFEAEARAICLAREGWAESQGEVAGTLCFVTFPSMKPIFFFATFSSFEKVQLIDGCHSTYSWKYYQIKTPNKAVRQHQ